jgi:hypothetical protein
MNIFLRGGLGAAALAVLLATLNACQPPSVTDQTPRVVSFDEALRDCRMKQPGRVNRRLSMRADGPSVAACLRRNGWDANGDRKILVASVASNVTHSVVG